MASRPDIFELLSGRKVGLGASTIRFALRCCEPLYASLSAARNKLFDFGLRRQHSAVVPVVSIGNLTTGGTGKTPLVRWVTAQLTQRGHQPVIVSRGYGSQDGQPNDEFLELQFHLPDVPHLQNPDRVTAARTAALQHDASVIVLDDGFQHRRLARDLDIVLIDATCPFGFDHLLPRGLLRESIRGLSRANLVLITRRDQVDPLAFHKISSQVAGFVPASRIGSVSFIADKVYNHAGESIGTESLQRQQVVAFCGIGNPAGFRKTLDGICDSVVQFIAFADHHTYTADCIRSLNRRASQSQADCFVCTHKDLVKLNQIDFELPLFALAIDPVFHDDTELLVASALSQL